MRRYIILDRIRNVIIKEKVGVTPIEEKKRETRLRWFGHVKRTSVYAPMRRCKTITLRHYRRRKG